MDTKTTLLASAIAAALALTAVTANAERGPRGGGERASFSELDANGDGEVTMAEMAAHAAARFAEADTNGDGSLSSAEMIAARMNGNADRLERRISRFIERADDNGNGTLELGEIGPSEERQQARFERLDTDGSGGISEEEMEAAREARGGRHGGQRGGDSDNG
ncbi:MAG: calcium-binding protein [Pseudomonadota bacterium]